MEKKSIIFEPSIPYLQKQNRISKRMGGIIMDMMRGTILKGNIDNDF